MSCGKRDIRFQDGPESRMVEQAEWKSPSVIRIRRSGHSAKYECTQYPISYSSKGNRGLIGMCSPFSPAVWS